MMLVEVHGIKENGAEKENGEEMGSEGDSRNGDEGGGNKGGENEEPGRRRRIYAAIWRFEIGQAALFGDVNGIILRRASSARGRQIYDIWVCGESHGRPFRTMVL
ncbi:hypothetical protein CWR43_28295 [Rhizobium sullae]|uniref:Uncharacterized protein n=1 Tax=Rhizobium sullae TaxID=50338 RepID=A0A2N0D2Z3_RHISU|nr:hypothetical protein [Rhizobium sullae]PKA40476.1 hypothetical protein CWR43_28295 [Rhizobium sullae]